MSPLTVSPESSTGTVYETDVSDIQTGLAVTGNKITGTLNYLDSGPIAGYWGNGNFMVLKFTNIDPDATSVLVGMQPSQGSGLQEIINDPDKNGVFKVTNKDTQRFKVVQKKAQHSLVQYYDLSELVCLNS